jgi:hypothetical protein
MKVAAFFFWQSNEINCCWCSRYGAIPLGIAVQEFTISRRAILMRLSELEERTAVLYEPSRDNGFMALSAKMASAANVTHDVD